MSLVLPETEYDAAAFLYEVRFRGGWSCERCGHVRASHLRCRPRVWQCNRCNRSISVTAGTVLDHVLVPLVKVVQAAVLVAQPGSISSCALAKEIEIRQPSAWYLGVRLRDGFLGEDAPFGGPAFLSQGTCAHRPPKGKKRAQLATGVLRLHFQLLWERGRSLAIRAGVPHTVATLALAVKRTGRPPRLAPPLAGTSNPTRLLDDTHHGVTARWLPHYLAAIAGWVSARHPGRDPAELTLDRALRPARHPLSANRPFPPPSPDLREWR